MRKPNLNARKPLINAKIKAIEIFISDITVRNY